MKKGRFDFSLNDMNRNTDKIVLNTEKEGVTKKLLPPRYKPSHVKIRARGKVDVNTVGLILENKMRKGRVIKYRETLLRQVAMNTTLQETQISLIPQGNAQGQRIADTVWLEKVEMTYNITIPGITASPVNLARVLLFRLKISTALATPTTNEIFSAYGSNFVHSYLNFEFAEQITYLLDRTYNVTGVNALSFSNNSQILEKISIPLNASIVQYDLGATTATGHLFFVWIADQAAAATNLLLTFNIRIWYYDE